jgi:hypothetical protein
MNDKVESSPTLAYALNWRLGGRSRADAQVIHHQEIAPLGINGRPLLKQVAGDIRGIHKHHALSEKKTLT